MRLFKSVQQAATNEDADDDAAGLFPAPQTAWQQQ
jgi:hypothetical protein